MAGRLEGLRREETLTGAQSLEKLMKHGSVDPYVKAPTHTQVPFIASRIDEPETSATVCMLSALGPEDSAYYQEEERINERNGGGRTWRHNIWGEEKSKEVTFFKDRRRLGGSGSG